MTASPLAICWFRQDLRLSDNPALCAAVAHGPVLPVFILDHQNAGSAAPGAASSVWLHHSLESLDASLGGALQCYEGDAMTILGDLIRRHGVTGVFWNRCYEPWQIRRDTNLKRYLREMGCETESFNGSLLWEPWEITKSDGTPYRVFTPFYRRGCLAAPAPRAPIPPPDIEGRLVADNEAARSSLLPQHPWATQIMRTWSPGEQGAGDRLSQFLHEGIDDYKEGRNYPAKGNVSRLSPHLHFGELSPNQVWYASSALFDDANLDHFLSELGWREFSYHLLYANPDMQTQNLQHRFDSFPWQRDSEKLKRWQRGQTGYPIVDAGMRELWQTGYMHNRVRMIVGSFLVKNLLTHWHEGERWFRDCLVDFDLANNSAGWQWIAGCGADAAPYFRVFNPVTQGQKFDPGGHYTRQYVPELGALSDRKLHCPWEATDVELSEAGIRLGVDYPHPIVELRESREAALVAFASTKDTV